MVIKATAIATTCAYMCTAQAQMPEFFPQQKKEVSHPLVALVVEKRDALCRFAAAPKACVEEFNGVIVDLAWLGKHIQKEAKEIVGPSSARRAKRNVKEEAREIDKRFRTILNKYEKVRLRKTYL